MRNDVESIGINPYGYSYQTIKELKPQFLRGFTIKTLGFDKNTQKEQL